jgi:methylase of polypeptide subunit release factors
VNAILAARAGAEVLGVDINPAAVDAARANADRNGVAAVFAVSDMFSAVDGGACCCSSAPQGIRTTCSGWPLASV